MASLNKAPVSPAAGKADGDPTARLVPIEADYCAWVEQQVALIRQRRLDAVDWAHVAEELSDMGRSELWRLRSALRVLLLHLLKWDQQPERRSRSWVASIAEQRRRVSRLLKDSPSLKARLADLLADAYEDARGLAAIETGLPDDEFPRVCPYEWTDLMDRPVAGDDLA
jgi:hypothetical protein